MTATEEFQPSRRILIAVDESQLASDAVDFTIQKIATPEDELVLVNVRPVPTNVFAPPTSLLDQSAMGFVAFQPFVEPGKVEAILKEQSHKLLRDLSQKVVAAKLRCRAVALTGDVRKQLDMEIQLLKPDLIVMGKTGRNAVSDFLLGSVSNHIAHTTTTPVIFYQ